MSKRDRIRRKKRPAVLSATRFATYSAAGFATVAGTSDSAEAGITYRNVNVAIVDTVLDPNNNSPPIGVGLSLPFGAGSSFKFELAHTLLATGNGGASAGGQLSGVNVPPGASFAGVLVPVGAVTFPYVLNLAAGQQINTQAFLPPVHPTFGTLYGLMAYGNGYPQSRFLNPGEGFIGVRFLNQHGWIRVQMNGRPLNSYTVVDYAFTTAGESITAGQTAIPEPGSLAFLALGAIGLASWRRRRAS